MIPSSVLTASRTYLAKVGTHGKSYILGEVLDCDAYFHLTALALFAGHSGAVRSAGQPDSLHSLAGCMAMHIMAGNLD